MVNKLYKDKYKNVNIQTNINITKINNNLQKECNIKFTNLYK